MEVGFIVDSIGSRIYFGFRKISSFEHALQLECFNTSEVNPKMAAVEEVNLPLLSKCLDFCQALASQGHVFNLSVPIGPSFSFPWTPGQL